MAATPPARGSPREKTKRIQSVTAGFAGGLAPFAINLAQALVGNSNLTVKPSIGYIVGMLIFGIAGAGMTYLFRELDPKKAFFLGIGAPAMIALAAKSNDSASREKGGLGRTPVPQVSISLVSSAYAQEAPRSSAQPVNGRTLEIQLNGTMPAATVVFLDASDKQLKTAGIQLHDYERITVPPMATSIVVRYGDSVTNSYPLSSIADQPQYIEVTGTEGRKDLDIFSAFTGEAKILYKIQLAEPSTAPLPKGQTGWVFLGAKTDGVWRRRYLEFATDAPQIGAIFYPRADLTMRASPSKDADRIGRVKKGQPLQLLQFTNIGPKAELNKADRDGEFYAQVKVQ